MDNKIIILFLIIFLLTTPILGLVINMTKYLVYLLLLLGILSYIKPDIATNIKNYLIQIINTDGIFFTNIFSILANKIKSLINNYTSLPNTSSSNTSSSNNNSPNNNSPNINIKSPNIN